MLQDPGGTGGPQPSGTEIILDSHRHACQRAVEGSVIDLLLNPVGMFQKFFLWAQGQECSNVAVCLMDLFQCFLHGFPDRPFLFADFPG